MIVNELYDGAGLGNQLWCYAVTRSIAKRLGYTFGIKSIEKFHGRDFLDLDFGEAVEGGYGVEGEAPIELPKGISNYYKEKKLMNGIFDVSTFDIDLYNVKDNTKVDGNMQTEKYFIGMQDEVKDWIKIKRDKIINITDDICIIHIRGGDFLYSTAFLSRDYYINAINHMKSINGCSLKFYIVTDDIRYSKSILPEIEIIGGALDQRDTMQASHHNGGTIWKDYSLMNVAKFLIIGASSFAWWAAWTNKRLQTIIAPKYWAAHKQSDSFWSTGDSYVKGWSWLDRQNNIYV